MIPSNIGSGDNYTEHAQHTKSQSHWVVFPKNVVCSTIQGCVTQHVTPWNNTGIFSLWPWWLECEHCADISLFPLLWIRCESCFRYVVPPIWMSLIPVSLVLISPLQFVWLCRRMTKRVSSQIWTQRWLVRDCRIMANDYLWTITHIPPLIQRWRHQLGAKSPYFLRKMTQDQIQERINRLRVSEVCVLKYDSHRHQKNVPNLFH